MKILFIIFNECRQANYFDIHVDLHTGASHKTHGLALSPMEYSQR